MEWVPAFMIAGSTISACYLMHLENKSLAKEFAQETKGFHGRLCALEGRYHTMMRDLIMESKQ